MSTSRNEFLKGIRDDDLRNKARTVLERDAKHALNSPDPEVRLLGVRAVQAFLD